MPCPMRRSSAYVCVAHSGTRSTPEQELSNFVKVANSNAPAARDHRAEVQGCEDRGWVFTSAFRIDERRRGRPAMNSCVMHGATREIGSARAAAPQHGDDVVVVCGQRDALEHLEAAEARLQVVDDQRGRRPGYSPPPLGKPMRPRTGSLSAGRAKSMPKVSPRMLISIPSSAATSTPSAPSSEN